MQNPQPVISFELTDEQRLVQETAREFADSEIVPRARENDRNEHFDLDLVAKLGEMGYLGVDRVREVRRARDRLPHLRADRGAGGPGDSSARTMVSVQTSLVCSSIERWGTEEQKQRWLPRLCSGEALAASA